MKALFLVSSVGLGHVARSYRISEYLKRKGFKTYWVAAEPCISFLKLKGERICDESYELKSLCDVAERMFKNYKFNFSLKLLREELNIIKYNARILEEFPFENFDVIICDEFYEFYLINRKVENAIYITDFVEFPSKFFPISFILNDFLNRFYKKFRYRFFAGIKEELRRDDFIPIGYIASFDKIKVPRSDEFSILLTFGGSNVGKYAIKILSRYLKNIDAKIYIALGPRISEEEIPEGNFTCIGFTTEIYKYFAKASVVITSGGYSTISDLLYLRKPTIIFPIRGHFEQINRAKILQSITNHIFILEKIEDIYDAITIAKNLKEIKSLPKSYFEQYKRIYKYVTDML